MATKKELRFGSPIEVYVTFVRNEMQVRYRVVKFDESTHEGECDSASIRGAQREVTGWLIAEGYAPAGRWQADDGTEDVESYRLFKAAEA
ncbi:MAG TPA: hypothetical protein VMM60_16430 [Ilumatobacter sp.]|nr:hypothetical protein [Ilumatobacter sp.]